MFKKIVIFLILVLISFADEKTNAFNLVNKYRQIAGMIGFSPNSYLDKAAYNHSHYMAINNIHGHYEDSSKAGFTGTTPSDRAYYVGYKSGVGENVSTGDILSHNYKKSVLGLFSAIYHRLGFLSFEYDEMGCGIDKNEHYSFYTYDMGNSMINSLCSGDSYEGYGEYYYGICQDPSFKIAKNDYDFAINFIKKKNPEIVIWPPKDSNFTEPVFYEEYPDPLPNQSVSGYPVSISFNDYYFQIPPILKSFTLKDFETNETIKTIFMDKNSDPNKEFNEYEFAIFPSERLKWGEVYQAKIVYEINGNEHNLTWCYQTKDYPYRKYIITGNNVTLNIMPNKEYLLYFKPRDKNDVFNGYSTQSYISSSKYDVKFIDENTLYFKTIANSGNINLALSNGINITLNISDNDNAIAPIDKSNVLKLCSNNQIDSLSRQELNITKGWNLVSIPVDLNLSYNDLNSTFKSAKIIWKYDNGSWKAYTKSDIQNLLDKENIPKIKSIKRGEGFWIYSDTNTTISFEGKSYNISVKNLSNGWHLFGAGSKIAIQNLISKNTNIKTIWTYKNGWRAYGVNDLQNLLDKLNIPRIDTIKRGEGFWVNVE